MKLNSVFVASLLTVSINAAGSISPKQCQNQCKGDVGCLTQCLGLPNPTDDQASATQDCNTQCTDTSTGTVPNDCFNKCIESIFNINNPDAKFSTSDKPTSSSPTSITDATKTKQSKSAKPTSSSDSSSNSESSSTKSGSTQKANTTANKSTYTKSSQKVIPIDSSAYKTVSSIGSISFALFFLLFNN